MRTVYDADLLLVDDNPDLLRLLSDQLSGAGYRHIRTAANCAAAQTAFACKTPELMILDINLPDGDGFSLFRFLREKVDVPALFLSARDADYAGYENSLGVHIRHLREKIEAEPSRPRWLLTARGIGYKLAGEESR